MPAIGIPLLFPILRDEDDFEDLCRDLLRTYWKRPSLERFGRKGQRQYGIDILDLGGVFPLHAAQCKLREYGGVLSAATISAEVGEARKFQLRSFIHGNRPQCRAPGQATIGAPRVHFLRP